MKLVGDIALSLRIFCRKRGSACRRSEFIFLSRADGRSFLDVWALGDCAVIPTNRADYYPPTAQRASPKVRWWHTISSRAFAVRPWSLSSSRHSISLPRSVVARILGINFSGFIAWWLWRTIYLLKLLRLPKAPWILSKHRMDTLQFLIVSDDSRSCKDL